MIDIVNTLRGAECEEATFDPPALKPATIAGKSGSSHQAQVGGKGSLRSSYKRLVGA